MSLYGGRRDAALVARFNRELINRTITQQVGYYKFVLSKTETNIYGESTGGKFYNTPLFLNCLVDRADQNFPIEEKIADFSWGINFYFFRQDLVDLNLVPEVGDIIFYYEGYYEVDNVISNELFVGKNPEFTYDNNPTTANLANFGLSISVKCATHYIPADRVQISRER